MATIGLDSVYYSKITDGENGEETYAVPKKLAPAIMADISVELATGNLYADDKIEDSITEFSGGKLKLGTSDLPPAVLEDLFGVTVDSNGVIVSAAEDQSNYAAVGFRSKTSKGPYRYVWLYRVIFGVPSSGFETKNNGISFKTPEIEGTIMARNKPLPNDTRPWKAEITAGQGITASVIDGWFSKVYEPETD